MSHILRNRFDRSGKRSTPASIAQRRTNGDGSRKSQGSQSQQILLQRRTVTQDVAPVQQLGSQQGRNQVSRVIEETLADIQVLEELQNEAQRRLANARLVKQNHLDQHATLELELAKLKYYNGEKRAQIVRARELLSSSHRELSSLQTASDRNGNSIRGMEAKLSKGLDARRIALVLHRQLHLRITLLVQAEINADQYHSIALEKVDSAEKMCEELEQRQLFLVKTRKEQLALVQKITDNSVYARTESLRLEQELTFARQLDSSAKLRAESVTKELAAERRRSFAAVAIIQETVHDGDTMKSNLEAKQSALLQEVNAKKDLLRSLRLRLLTYHDERSQTNDMLASVSAKSVLENLKKAVDHEQDVLKDQILIKGRVETSLTNTLLSTTTEEQDILLLREKCQNISERLQEGNAHEAARKKSAEVMLGALEKERGEVERLHAKLDLLTKTKEPESVEAAELIDEQSCLHQQKVDELGRVLRDLEIEKKSVFDLKRFCKETQEQSTTKVDQARRRLTEAQQTTERLRDLAQRLPSTKEDEAEIQNAIGAIKTARMFLVSDLHAEISRIKKKYPPLRDFEVAGDPSKSTEEIAKDVFKKLISKCDEMLNQARQRRDESKVGSMKNKKEHSKRVNLEDTQRQTKDHLSRDVSSEVRDESNSLRTVTFLDVDRGSPQEKIDSIEKSGTSVANEGVDNLAPELTMDVTRFDPNIPSRNPTLLHRNPAHESIDSGMRKHDAKKIGASLLEPLKEIIDLEADDSILSPTAQTDINSFTHSGFPDYASETKPRDLLPAFTQASKEDNSVDSVQGGKRVHWGPNDRKKTTRDASGTAVPALSSENSKVQGSKARGKYGAMKSGSGAIFRQHKPSQSSNKTSFVDDATRSLHIKSSDHYDESIHKKKSFELDRLLGGGKISSLANDSQQRTSSNHGLGRNKSSSITHDPDKFSRSNRHYEASKAKQRDSVRGHREVNREIGAKFHKSEPSLEPNTKRSIPQKDGKGFRIKRDAAHQETAKPRDPKTSVEGSSITAKRKSGSSIEPNSKRSRTMGTNNLAVRSKPDKLHGAPKSTTGFAEKECGKAIEIAGSTQASGISSMERVPPKKSKKRAMAPKVSRGLAPLADIDEYNFHS